ncbi:MAG: triose-phosphate isomerase [Bacteroidetes bacterium]|nr:triose-phosphate isomerase [Bacteroidota bacterium]
MFKTHTDANQLVDAIADGIKGVTLNAEVWIAPAYIFIESLQTNFGFSGIKFGAQDVSRFAEGAYTGEVSAPMLKSIDTHFVIVGHSERRQYHQENDVLIAEKITAALNNKLQVVYCCGETLEQRNSGNHFDVVKQQVATALFNLSSEQITHLVIAYEPVWAIGTGVTATSAQAQEMHAFIRNLIAAQFGNAHAAAIRILYGGSVKPNNSVELFSQPDIDGGLIGGASLVADDFLKIIQGV